jgi:hypothetical protein
MRGVSSLKPTASLGFGDAPKADGKMPSRRLATSRMRRHTGSGPAIEVPQTSMALEEAAPEVDYR